MTGVLGLIPAKGGSTRLAMKNIRALGGRPLLAWTAAAARQSGIVDRLIVSTESPEVADVARGLGLEVPFMRPAELARDPAGIADVALHALDALERDGAIFDTIVVLLATCPLADAQDIRGAYDLFRRRPASFVLSVAPFDHTPYIGVSMDAEGNVAPLFPQYYDLKSQDMPPAYRPNGAVQVASVAALRAQRTLSGKPLLGYLMPVERSIDIDTEFDFQCAEAMAAVRGDKVRC